MTFDDLVRELGLGAEHEVWRAAFETSSGTSDRTAPNPSQIESTCRWIGLDDSITSAAVEAARGLLKQPGLTRLLRHCHHQLFIDPAGAIETPWSWRPLPGSCGPCGRMFYALLLLDSVSHVHALHARHNIPDSVTRDTLGDLEVWMRVHRERFGCWGLDGVGWLSFHWTGRLVRLGRLQFEMAKFPLPFRVMQHVRDGTIVALAEPGLRVRHDGQFADADGGGASEEEIWTTGPANPVNLSRGCIEKRQCTPTFSGGPEGRAHLSPDQARPSGPPLNGSRAPVLDGNRLDPRDWREVLRCGEPALSVHIPAIGPLTPEECDESFRLATEFFPKHFPGFGSRGFFTMTWMLDPQLAEHLPAESNLVKFLQRWRLLPLPGANGDQTLERVFGWDKSKAGPAEYDTLPQDTSLQRVVLSHLRAGGKWRGGAGFIL